MVIPTSLLCPWRAWIAEVNRASLRADFWAGLTGAVVVLPQGIAFALIAGLPPVFGLYSAVVVQLIAGFWGSSRQMVSGPTVALSIVVPAIVGPYAAVGSAEYVQLALVLMFLVGLVQLCLAALRLGALVDFISHSVVLGFTAGAGMLIVLSQLPAFLGLTLPLPSDFGARVWTLIQALPRASFPSTLVAATTLGLALGVRRWQPRAPYLLLGILGGSALSYALEGEVHDIKMLGALPAAWPHWGLPPLSWARCRELFPSALALALLGLIEAVSIARALGLKNHQRIDGTQEFWGQGLANLVGSFCSCYVGSGSFSRSAINADSGAQTPLALLVTSAVVVLVLVFLPASTRFLPLPAMAGAIVLAGYNLFQPRQLWQLARHSWEEFAVALTTLLATLLLHLQMAIYAGVALSLLLVLKTMARPELVVRGERVLELRGPLFFAALPYFEARFAALVPPGKKVLLRLGGAVDMAGAQALETLRQQRERAGGGLVLLGLEERWQTVFTGAVFSDEAAAFAAFEAC